MLLFFVVVFFFLVVSFAFSFFQEYLFHGERGKAVLMSFSLVMILY